MAARKKKPASKKKMRRGGLTQGYNARLDESLGAKRGAPSTQSLASRRAESKGARKPAGTYGFKKGGTAAKKKSGRRKT